MLAEYEFVSILKQNIRPAQPIDVPELLQGREPILRDIRRTLHSPGMHVFVHGERGIGKTSIALTAAKAYLRADRPGWAAMKNRPSKASSVMCAERSSRRPTCRNRAS